MINLEVVRSCFSSHPRGLDVVIFGHIFGGKPGEAPQDFRTFELDAETLTLFFNTTEKMEIFGAESIELDYSGALMIPIAKKIVWGWHWYGRSQTPANWCTYTYILQEDGDVWVSVEGPIREQLSRFGNPDRKYPRSNHPAVQLR